MSTIFGAIALGFVGFFAWYAGSIISKTPPTETASNTEQLEWWWHLIIIAGAVGVTGIAMCNEVIAIIFAIVSLILAAVFVKRHEYDGITKTHIALSHWLLTPPPAAAMVYLCVRGLDRQQGEKDFKDFRLLIGAIIFCALMIVVTKIKTTPISEIKKFWKEYRVAIICVTASLLIFIIVAKIVFLPALEEVLK